MKAYGIDDAKSIIRHYGQNFFEFRADGVFLLEEMLQYDPSQQLHWKYVCELDGPRAPNPLTAPCLPFPFTAHQLAAFMLDGVGAVIPSVYGDWEGGPDQEMLDDMGVLAREPRRAINDAYAAYVTAQTNAGKYPAELQIRAERLRKIFNYRNLKANTREGVFAHGIDRDEADARRARAVASNAGFKRQYELATKDYQAASGAWRKAMVNELLHPAPEQTAPVVTDQTEAAEPAAPAWSHKRPKRFQGYGKPLYDLLKAAHTAGQPRPSARDILDSWKVKPPHDVAEVTDSSLKYYDAKGNTKPADLEAIRKAIGRMTT